MAKLLVNAPTGEQQLIEVGIGGGYFDPSLVVWDERKDGGIPPYAELGSMVREGNDLIKLAEPLPKHKEWLEQTAEVVETKGMTLKELIDVLKTKGII